MTFRTVSLATALLTAAASPALAQNAAMPGAPAAATTTAPTSATTTAPSTAKVDIAVGAPVMDAKGGAVGTIASVTGDIAVIDTGVVKASVPTSSFAKSEKGLLISMTKVELESAAQGAAAAQQAEFLASLAPGLAISDQNGGAVGTIEAIEGDMVTIATPNAKAKLPKNAIAKGPNGPVIGMTQAQLEAAVSSSTPPAG